MRATLIYGVLLFAATFKMFSMPAHSYDAYYYSYLVSEDVKSFKKTPGLPPEYVAISDEAYLQQAPYYKVKPLYLALVRLSARLVGVLRAPHLVSVVAYFFLGWSVWLWLRSYGVNPLWRSLASIALMFSSVATDTGRRGGPDLLCTFLLVTGGWLVLSERYHLLGAAFWVMSICARQDSLILAGLLLGLAFWQGKVSAKVAVWSYLTMMICYAIVSRQGYPYRQLLAWTLRDSYWHALTHEIAKTELAIYAPFLLLAFIAIKCRFEVGVISACAASLVIRYVLMPHWEIRYLLPQAIVVGIVAAAAALRENKRSGQQQQHMIAS